jgi:hypothetical protein
MKIVYGFLLTAIVSASFIAFIACSAAPGGGSSSSSKSSTAGTKAGIMIDALSVSDGYGGNGVTPQWTLLTNLYGTNCIMMTNQDFVVNFDIYLFPSTYTLFTNGGHLQWYLTTSGYSAVMSTNLDPSITGPSQWCHCSSPVISNSAYVSHTGNGATNVIQWYFTYFRIQFTTPLVSQEAQFVIANVNITNTNNTPTVYALTNIIADNGTYFNAYGTAESDNDTVTNE